jgi:LmbE family N-acetylglucosaminyl deacetylase
MRWIYISPHLDDAIFSAGGLIYEQTQIGTLVEIWTIMSGFPGHVELSPFAKRIHQKWGTNSSHETIQIRRIENENAANIVGAKNRYLDFIDSLYRLGQNKQPLYTNSFSPLHKEDSDFPHKIASEISKFLLPGDILICPLALGGHIDHVIVREAIKLLGLSPFYMPDIPYLLDNPYALWKNTFGMKKSIHSISEIGLNYWLKAIRAYETQIKVEFETVELMEKRIIAYFAKNKGIQLWKKR